jgi:hypothetical protein
MLTKIEHMRRHCHDQHSKQLDVCRNLFIYDVDLPLINNTIYGRRYFIVAELVL